MAWLVALAVTGLSRGATVMLPGLADAGLREIVPDRASGVDVGLRAGNTALSVSNRTRALFWFDPARQIPSGSTVVSARLTMSVAMTTDTLPRSFDLRRMLVPWSEDAATWNLRLPPDVTWSAPGAVEGVDFAANASDSIAVGLSGAYSWGSTSGMVADVQRWLDNPAKNYGWMLLRSDESVPRTTRLFNSRESTNGPPQLAVEFNPPFRIISTGITDNRLCLQFRAEAGKGYVVERRNQVDAGVWTIVTNVPPTDADGFVTVCDPLAPESHFYRVGVE